MLPIAIIVLTSLAALAALVAFYVSAASLLGPESELATSRARPLDEEKRALLRSLKDLEHERAIEKLSDEDFRTLEASTRARLRVVMEELDRELAPFRAEAEARVLEALGDTPAAPAAERQAVPSERAEAADLEARARALREEADRLEAQARASASSPPEEAP